MKKILSILSTFTAVSVVAPAVVACAKDTSIDEIVTTISKDTDVITKAKAYYTDTTKEGELKTAILTKLDAELKAKLKDKKEAEEVVKIAKTKYTITITKGTDVVKIKVEKPNWDDAFASTPDKKADQKETYNLITGTSKEVEVSTK